MLKSDFARFGLGLEVLLRTHGLHSPIASEMATLSTNLRGKYRLMDVIMRNSGDQNKWAPILYLVADQFQKIGNMLGPEKIETEGLAFEYEKLGDLLGQFVDQHKVEFAYEKVQTKFKVWKNDIDATFQALEDELKAQEKQISDPNFTDLAGIHEQLTKSFKNTLASPVKLMNLQFHNHRSQLGHQKKGKRNSKKAMLLLI